MSDTLERGLQNRMSVEWSQYHLAVAGGCEAFAIENFINYLAFKKRFAPTRYREVVLTPFRILQEALKRIGHKQPKGRCVDIGLSRLAETFSLEVTVLTPVTQRRLLRFYPVIT